MYIIKENLSAGKQKGKTVISHQRIADDLYKLRGSCHSSPDDEGAAVELLQLALDRAGFGPLETDGIFGPATEAALRRFQQREGLAADGVAGPLSFGALRPWLTGYRLRRVRAGDTLWAIAREYGTTVEAIETANPGVRPEALMPGQTLVIPLGFPLVPTAIRWNSHSTILI